MRRFTRNGSLAPGQLSLEQMSDIYHYDQINPDTDVYGLIADPVVAQLGPLLHNEAFRHLKIDKVSVPFRVPREQLESFIGYCRQFGIRGLSVNMPHKEAVLPFVSETDLAVDHIGAANTVVIDGFDRSAFNTEYRAALESIDSTLGRGGEIDVLNGKTALILGAGAWPRPWPTRCARATSMPTSLRVRRNVHTNWPVNSAAAPWNDLSARSER